MSDNRIEIVGAYLRGLQSSIIDALEDDLNTPKALAEMFDFARTLNKTEDAAERQKLATELLAAGDLVGLMQGDPEAWFSGSDEGDLSSEDIESLLAQREAARANGDYAAADKVRDELAGCGITIEDGPLGTRWRRS